MADLANLPPDLQKLFQPPPPIKYIKPVDIPPEKRSTRKISGIAQYLDEFNKAKDDGYVGTENWLQKVKREKKLKAEQHEKKLKESIERWDPNKDPQIRGDPFKTLFISRLNYNLVERDLEDEFSKHGPLERIRLVRDEDGNSRGYAFVVFEQERDMKKALRESGYLKLKGRRVVVDVERGRTVKAWKPRRLGGGKGGRNYTKEDLLRSKDVRDDRGRGGYSSYDRFAPPPGSSHARDRYDDRDRGGYRNGGGGGWRGDRRNGERDYRDRERERERNGWRAPPPRERERERDPRDRDRDRDHDIRRPSFRDRSPPRRY